MKKKFLFNYTLLLVLIYFFSSPAFHLQLLDSWYIQNLHYIADNFFSQFDRLVNISHRVLFPLLLLLFKKYFFFNYLSYEIVHIFLVNLFILFIILFTYRHFLKLNKNYAFNYTLLLCSSYICIGSTSFPYYPDTLTVSLLILAYIFATKNYIISSVFIFLSCLSHEMAILGSLLIFYTQYINNNNKKNIICIYLLFIFSYLFFIFFIKNHINQTYSNFYETELLFSFSLNKYLEHLKTTMNLVYTGNFFSFKALWFLVILSFLNYKRVFSNYFNFNIYLFLVIIVLFFNFAYQTDVSRHVSVLLFIVIFSICEKFSKLKKYNTLVKYLSFFQLLIPNIYIWSSQSYFINPLIIELIVKSILDLFK